MCLSCSETPAPLVHPKPSHSQEASEHIADSLGKRLWFGGSDVSGCEGFADCSRPPRLSGACLQLSAALSL